MPIHAPLRRWLLRSPLRSSWLRPLPLMPIILLRSASGPRCWKHSSTGPMQASPRGQPDSLVRGCASVFLHALLAWLWPLARLARLPILWPPCLRAFIASLSLSRRMAVFCWPALPVAALRCFANSGVISSIRGAPAAPALIPAPLISWEREYHHMVRRGLSVVACARCGLRTATGRLSQWKRRMCAARRLLVDGQASAEDWGAIFAQRLGWAPGPPPPAPSVLSILAGTSVAPASAPAACPTPVVVPVSMRFGHAARAKRARAAFRPPGQKTLSFAAPGPDPLGSGLSPPADSPPFGPPGCGPPGCSGLCSTRACSSGRCSSTGTGLRGASRFTDCPGPGPSHTFGFGLG